MNLPSHFFFIREESRFRVRPISPSDKELLQRGFGELSERSKYLRLFQINTKLSDAQLKYFTEVDGVQHVAWGVMDESNEEPKPVGVGRFVKYKEEQEVAEVAITVIDSYQGIGLGTLLFVTLNFIAAQMGLKKLRYYVLRENRFAMNSLKKFTILNQKSEGTVTILDISVIPNHKAIKNEPNMQRFITAMKKVEEEMNLTVFQRVAQVLLSNGNDKCKAKAAALNLEPKQATNLHLRELELIEQEVINIADLLATSSNLLSISFSYTKIGDVGAIALISYLPPSIQEIGLVDCGIGDRAGEVILEWLKSNSQLKMICMEQNNFSDKVLNQFKEIKRARPNLKLVM